MQLSVLKEGEQDRLKKNIKICFSIFIFLIFLLIIRLFYLDVIQHNSYKDIALNNRLKTIDVPASRGYIYDRNGVLLVSNQPSYVLYLENDADVNLVKLVSILDEIVEFDKERVLKDLRKAGKLYYNPVVVKKGLNFSSVSYLYENIHKYTGIRIDVEPSRKYFYPESLSHVIGYVGEPTAEDVKKDTNLSSIDILGKTGIELYYNDILKGENGVIYAQKDSLLKVNKILDEIPAKEGSNLRLTIDSQLQEYGYNIMKELNYNGSIVVMNVTTGELLAYVSTPSYDLNQFTPSVNKSYWSEINSNPLKPLLNRPISGTYAPGSVFKLIVAAAALELDIIDEHTTYNCPGYFRIGNLRLNCWRRSGHGPEQVLGAIKDSCDVFFYNVGLNLGIDNLSVYAKGFGYGSKTNIDLPNERSGFMPTTEWKKRALNEPWYKGESAISAIGQSYVSATPIQVAVSTASVLNGGYTLEPHILKAVLEGRQGEALYTGPTVINKVEMSQKTVDIIRKGMFLVINGKGGTAYRARLPYEYRALPVGGKTGTSQVVRLSVTEKYEKDEIPYLLRDHAWFVGVLPVFNPSYVVVVQIEHGISGGGYAAPVSQKIFTKLIELGYIDLEEFDNEATRQFEKNLIGAN